MVGHITFGMFSRVTGSIHELQRHRRRPDQCDLGLLTNQQVRVLIHSAPALQLDDLKHVETVAPPPTVDVMSVTVVRMTVTRQSLNRAYRVSHQNSLPYTNATCKRSPWLFCPRQPCYLGHTAHLTASAVVNRSLMWAYHITGTPGCSTPKADNQHSME